MRNFSISNFKKLICRKNYKAGESKSLILMYHRIENESLLDDQITVSQTHFRDHLEVLRRIASPVPLNQLVYDLEHENHPENAVAITFDDGYATTLYHAKPFLDKFNMPATVFIVTESAKGCATFWWDKLERILLEARDLTNQMKLSFGRKFELDLDIIQKNDNVIDQKRSSDKINMIAISQEQRRNIYINLVHQMLPMTEIERDSIIESLALASGVSPKKKNFLRSLSVEELSFLAQDSIITIGAHTMTHPFLSALSIEDQQAEIEGSKAYLENILKKQVKSFAYPYGAYTQETAALVREAGYDYACTVLPDVVRTSSSPLELPRMTVEDWNGEEFEARINAWFKSEE